MSDLNEKQLLLANHIDGMVVVDAGPGTGKTHTIVDRYVNMVKSNIDPMKIMMLTFTRNAAEEMKARITKKLISMDEGDSKAYRNMAKNVRTTTFDSKCLNIVLDSPESVNDFFCIKESLSRSAHLVENETLNREYFRNFYAKFINEHSGRYHKDGKDPAALIGNKVNDLYKIINKLMSRGIIPMEYEWFGKGERLIEGRTDDLFITLKNNEKSVKKAIDDAKRSEDDYALPDELGSCDDEPISDDILRSISHEDRFMLFEFIRDVYFGYIRSSIADNRLTFGLVELFAFAILYSDRRSREMHTVDYMMVDEFQDTNELQLKICLLLLNKPNLCVVGDWKQGIYGFRFVSIENITQFEDRVDLFITELNRDDKRIPFKMVGVKCIEFTENYRSSSLILEKVFRSLELKGSEKDVIENANVVLLNAKKDELYGDNTSFDMIQTESLDDEIDIVIKKIKQYISDPKYVVFDKDGNKKKMSFGDIAVLCRNGKLCRQILDRCSEQHIPAFFQGDLEIMSTREGKLVLAWLRYVNNSKDKRGMMAILSDRGYSLSQIETILGEKGTGAMPDEFNRQRFRLLNKRRRPNDLLTTIFAFYGLDNDITQSIITVLSSAYSNSLMTLSDLIRLIEEDIKNGTKYNVDQALDAEAVTIQTMHKSKGLEYPAVIIAGINQRSMPNTNSDKEVLRYSDAYGIRCTKEYRSTIVDDTEYDSVLNSWRYNVLKGIKNPDYSEDRRLMFVATSRAKQYLTVTSYNPSRFFKDLGTANDNIDFDEFEMIEKDVELSKVPVIGDYATRRRSLSPHDLMSVFKNRVEDTNGEGTKYGTKVHEYAYSMWRGRKCDVDFKEHDRIKEILDSVSKAITVAEERFVLPVDDVSIKGTIDLLAEFDDHIEIHDYKTDGTKANRKLYELQLSIYAAAVASTTDKPIECYIDYLNIGSDKVENMYTMEDIRSFVKKYYELVSKGELSFKDI
ncbi:UvrD-helicase domain-containing protein [Candidatus Methanarcanum hacksteinii]|uniref:UvrD-helicase domain-containing protein n=1 Tax=Candidatus Methanarcanum hacksteinii TaxID=2911857 RepID=UPI0037DD9FF6